VVEINDRMRRMIHDRVSEQELEAFARTRSPSIYADGVRRVLNGDTTLEEVLRVTHEME
jgi:general secretion pathway protein E